MGWESDLRESGRRLKKKYDKGIPRESDTQGRPEYVDTTADMVRHGSAPKEKELPSLDEPSADDDYSVKMIRKPGTRPAEKVSPSTMQQSDFKVTLVPATTVENVAKKRRNLKMRRGY